MVSGACSNQLKVNAIAVAAFRFLRVLLDFLWIWFSLPRFGCAQLVAEVGLTLEPPDQKT
jgi:hypothetical protein